MSKKDWKQTAFHFEYEVWRVPTVDEMIVLYKKPEKTYYSLLRFNDDGGKLVHISEEEAFWLTLEYLPEHELLSSTKAHT